VLCDVLVEKNMTVKYEMRFKTKGAPWKVFDNYKSKGDPELKKHYGLYSNHRIIEEVEVIEIKTTRKKIDI
jgi:hypothetical protein